MFPFASLHWTDVSNRCLHKQGDASVGHGKGQTQDATAHDGVAQVEDGHAKGGTTLVLWKRRRTVRTR